MCPNIKLPEFLREDLGELQDGPLGDGISGDASASSFQDVPARILDDSAEILPDHCRNHRSQHPDNTHQVKFQHVGPSLIFGFKAFAGCKAACNANQEINAAVMLNHAVHKSINVTRDIQVRRSSS